MLMLWFCALWIEYYCMLAEADRDCSTNYSKKLIASASDQQPCHDRAYIDYAAVFSA